MLKRLFDTEYFIEYIPKSRDLLYSLLFLAVGTKSFFYDRWETFGSWVFVVGVFHALIVLFAMAWQAPIKYWKTINEHIVLMTKNKDPELWAALGYKKAPASVVIEEKKYNDLGQIEQIKKHYVDAPAASMSLFANTVLKSGNVEFTEERFGSVFPKWRQVQKDFKEKGFITPKITNHPRSGYKLTKKGIDMVYQYATEETKLYLKSEKREDKSNEE